jgi:hypothetical protein
MPQVSIPWHRESRPTQAKLAVLSITLSRVRVMHSLMHRPPRIKSGLSITY